MPSAPFPLAAESHHCSFSWSLCLHADDPSPLNPQRKTEKKALALDDAEGKPTCLLLKIHSNHGRTTAVWKPVPRSCPPRNKTYWGLGKLYHKCWDATANCCSKFRCIFEGTDSGSQWVWVNIGKWWSGVWSLELFSCPSIFASGVFWGHSLQEVGMYNFLLHGWCPNWWLKPQTCNQRSLKNRLKHQLMRIMSLALSGHRVQGSFEHRAFQEIATIPMGSFWSFIKLKST